MAKKRGNQGRRVQPTLASADAEYKGPSSENQRAELEFYGKKREQLVDISTQMESIFNLQQQQVQEADRHYGIEKQLLNNLGVYENKVKLIALQKKLLNKMSLEDSNIIKQTVSDYEDYNREAANVTKKTQELLRFKKEQVPFEDKIRGMQAEITNLQAQGVKNLSDQNKEKLKDLQTMEKGYQALSKQEQMNKRIEKIQDNITDAMKMQGTAVGEILGTLKDIVTNPLVLFTGLLALGVSRYEEMRQRGNQLAEEMDRVNKSLAGAGPYQDKIIQKARLIRSEFNAAGEGFASSMENSVTAVVALEKQIGNVDFVSGQLVKTMSKLKLSIGLSDEESAKVLDNFMIMSNLSEDAAINATKVTYQMSETVGLNPAEVFKDIASASAETLAHFTGGAHQIAKAAVEARRMGLTLQDVASISKGLLDFETSIEAEMEAQMLTGMDLNFNKARMFAMNKQGGKAAEEVMRQVGGLQKFQKMNIFQQEAIAKATGLDLNTLLKSNVQREREAKQLRDKDKLVGKQLTMSIEVTKMMGKLDAGLGIMQQIANVLGDLFLDIFMPSMKKGEDVLMGFIKGDKFKTVITSILKGVKSVVDAIVDIFKWIGNSTVFKAISNYMGGGKLSASSPGSMDKEKSDNRIGNALKIGLAGYAAFKLGSFLMPMWVRMKGGVGGMFGGKGGSGGLMDGIKKMFGFGGKGGIPGPLKMDGTPDLRYAANRGLKGMGGAGAAGTKFMGMNLGSAMGGTSGSLGTAMGGTALGSAGAVIGGLGAAAFIGKGFYDVSNITQDDSLASAKKAHAGKGGAMGGALAGAAIGSVVPVIGTLLGAGIGAAIGYFGARASSASANYMTDLERSQEKAIEATEELTELERLQSSRTNQRRIRRQIKVQKSFDGLAKDGDVTGDALKQLSQDLVDSGLISKKVFAQMSKDGKITSAELNKMLKGITGGWEWGSGKDSPGKKDKEYIIESLTENKVLIKSIDDVISTVKAGENVKGSLLFDLMSSSTLSGDAVAKGQDDKRLGYTSYFRGSAAEGSLASGSDADALRFQSVKNAVSDQLSDDQIRKVLDKSYTHTISLMNEMKTSEKDEITGEDFERSLSLAIVRGISAELTVDKVNLRKAQINTEEAVGDVTKISKDNATDIITKLDQAKVQNSLENDRQLKLDQFINLNPSADTPGYNFGYAPQSQEDYGALDMEYSTRDRYNRQKTDIMNMSREDLTNFVPYNLDNASDMYRGFQFNFDELQLEENAKGGILPTQSFNSGGVLYGPSHAGGGIPTRFGELEGGEAVINKRSTAMFASELSQINQAGGGKSFAGGGVTPKYAGGGILTGHFLKEALMFIGILNAKSKAPDAGEYMFGNKGKGEGQLGESFGMMSILKNASLAAELTGMALTVGGASSAGIAGVLGGIGMGGATAAMLGNVAMWLGPIGATIAGVYMAARLFNSYWQGKHGKGQQELADNGGLTRRELIFDFLPALRESKAPQSLINSRKAMGFGGGMKWNENIFDHQGALKYKKGSTMEDFGYDLGSTRNPDAEQAPYSYTYKGDKQKGYNRKDHTSTGNHQLRTSGKAINNTKPGLFHQGRPLTGDDSKETMEDKLWRNLYGPDNSAALGWHNMMQIKANIPGYEGHEAVPNTRNTIPAGIFGAGFLKSPVADGDQIKYKDSGDFDHHGDKPLNIYLEHLSQSVTNKPLSYFAKSGNEKRLRAVDSQPGRPGYGYTDPYGYGPIPGRTGYSLEQTGGEFNPFKEDTYGIRGLQHKGKDGKHYRKANSMSLEDLQSYGKQKNVYTSSPTDYELLAYLIENDMPHKNHSDLVKAKEKIAADKQEQKDEYDRVFTKESPLYDPNAYNEIYNPSDNLHQSNYIPNLPIIKHERGGVIPHAPITKVNDMILTSDGQMIETHPDDNIIAKKGAITQTPAGGAGGTRVEKLLEGILMATQEGHIITIDGSKVSSAINSANHDI